MSNYNGIYSMCAYMCSDLYIYVYMYLSYHGDIVKN
jgi:hypothetical protein